ncbi:nucleoside triphosphate pyrophosphohydrolase, partial [Propionibacterium freudenreichii]|nr:nucleoside triphosphate pyrophosphohydrolase [Propionibacterium freudenreichii]
EKILSLVRRAQRVGVDADQATRAALRRWEAEIRAAEQS